VTAVPFGGFVLDPDTRELRRGRAPVALSPKAFQLLELLVAHRPKALSKATLQQQLWPDTFVLEKNLVNLVAEIRDALGDSAANPRFVRTVPRFGYAFRDASSQSAGAAAGARGVPVRFRLVWTGGRATLSDGEYVLGRDPDLELFLDAQDVSRHHARIRIAGDSATIEDLDSKNGTFVSDRRVGSAARLVDGASIRVGSVRLTFTAVRNPGSTQTEAL
jgi:DNA-binding winged helix-turn-helix (wHTH) protein